MIADLGHAGKVDLAFEVFQELQATDIPPSIWSYERLLGACEKVRDGHPTENKPRVAVRRYVALYRPNVQQRRNSRKVTCC